MEPFLKEVFNKLPASNASDCAALCEAVLLYKENYSKFIKNLGEDSTVQKAYFYILVNSYSNQIKLKEKIFPLNTLLNNNLIINFNEITSPLITLLVTIELENNDLSTIKVIKDYIKNFVDQDVTNLIIFEETANTILMIRSLLQSLVHKQMEIFDYTILAERLCALAINSPSKKVYQESIELIKLLFKFSILQDAKFMNKVLKEDSSDYEERLLMVMCDLNDYLFSNANLLKYFETWYSKGRIVSENIINCKRRFYILRKNIDAIIEASQEFKTDIIFWDPKRKQELETAWDAFFTIIENMGGNHRHLIIPSFGLLPKIACLGKAWTGLIIQRGLQNDSKNVRYACIRYLFDHNEIVKYISTKSFTNAINDTCLFDGKQMNLERFENFLKKFPSLVKVDDLQKSIPIYYASKALLKVLEEMIPKENTFNTLSKDENKLQLIIDQFNAILRSLKSCQNTDIREIICIFCIPIFIDRHLYFWANKFQNLNYLDLADSSMHNIPTINYAAWCKIRDSTTPFQLKKQFMSTLNPPNCQNKLDELYRNASNKNNLDKTIIDVLENEDINIEYTEKLLSVVEEILENIEMYGIEVKIDKNNVQRLIGIIQQKNTSIRRKMLAIKLFSRSQNKYKSSNNCLFTSKDKILDILHSARSNRNEDFEMSFVDAVSEFRSKKLNFTHSLSEADARKVVALSLQLVNWGSVKTLETELSFLEKIMMDSVLADSDSYTVMDICNEFLQWVITEKKSKQFQTIVLSFLQLTKYIPPSDYSYDYMARNYYKPLFDLCPSLIAKFLNGNIIELNNFPCFMEKLLQIDIDLMLVDQMQTKDQIMECSVSGSETHPYIYTFFFPTCFEAIPADLLISRYYEISKSHSRYFADSQIHRKKLRIVQYLSILSVRKKSLCQNYISKKMFDALFKENNQLNVTYLLELIVANAEAKDFKALLEPSFYQNLQPAALQSLFVVLFYRCQMHHYDKELQNKCINIMLPHTMGQHFATRLYAQVIVQRLMSTNPSNEYKIISDTIERLQATQPDKNYKRVKDDFRWNILQAPHYNISYFLHSRNVFVEIPRVTQMSLDFYKGAWFMENESTLANVKPLTITKKPEIQELSPSTDNVQVKIIPRKQIDFNIADLNDFSPQQIERKASTQSKLIIVASLLKKFPNLGGLARTCEIFNTKLYVISSVKHLENQEFQSLSVTAEKWLNIAEVQSWQVGDYLVNMKKQGYVVVGAEQTANSEPITKFNFPQKCILLLGEEREGIPANLISLLDYAVEVPQLGITPSLNVHVCASLFIWEYVKQHQLSLV